MAEDLSGYTVKFTRNGGIRTWSWQATTPDGRSLSSMGDFIDRRNAELDALAVLERDHPPEGISGEELRRRVKTQADESELADGPD